MRSQVPILVIRSLEPSASDSVSWHHPLTPGLLIGGHLRMREGPDEEVVAACFSTVAVCLQRLFQRLPRSQELSEKLQTPQRLCGKALAHGRSLPLHPEMLQTREKWLFRFPGLYPVAFLMVKECGILQAVRPLVLNSAPLPGPTDSAESKAWVLLPCLTEEQVYQTGTVILFGLWVLIGL